MVGTWRGDDGATLTLAADHFFDAGRLPLHRTEPSSFEAPWTGAGDWLLSSPDRYDVQSVSLSVGRHAVPVYRHRSDDGIRLYLWIGRIDLYQRYWMDLR